MKKIIKKFPIWLIILIVISLLGFLQPVKAGGYVYGIDVSHWQGSINWNKVYNAGYRFAFCKASEGTSYKDDRFTTNMNQGKSAGLFLGPYHYAHPDSNTYTAEAAHFVSVIQSYMIDGYLRPVLDLEVGHSLGKTALTNWVINFINYVKDHTGVEPIIYCNSWYASTYLDSRVTQYDLWIAHWNVESPNTGIWDAWSFWQYKVSSAGYVPGISGQCDLDLFNGGMSDLRENFVIKSSQNERVKYKGHEYQLFTTEKNWADAKADCEARAGHLVTITSAGENNFVKNLADSNKIWIGLTDEANEGTWQWITGEYVVFSNWIPGEPNNYRSGEDYAEMDIDGRWNDIGPPEFPSIIRYYVCEWGDKVEYNKHQYQLCTTEKNWPDAKAECEDRGGHLVTITSKGENDFIKNLAGSNKVWIGLTDKANEGTWEWVIAEDVVYTNWYPGEPNNYGSGEDYVEMYIDGRWNDNGPPQFPSTTLYYVCEWEEYWYLPSKPPETEIVYGPSGTIDYNNITFSWIGSDDYTPSSELKYSYKLEGYETSWSFWLSKTTKEYKNLPNGDYTFKVRAKDREENIEQAPVQQAFTVNLKLKLGLDEYLVRLIDRYAPLYYNDFWDVSISQYKSWIALMTLREAGFGRYAAHSQRGRTVDDKGNVNCDRFNHRAIGYKFPFSTGIGAFQLDRGGSQGNANENWGVLPTIKKLNPSISLVSLLRWHRDRFFWDKATLADFSLNSAWCALYPSKQSGFSADWKKITGYDWDKCKTRKIDVNFTPPIVDDPYSNNVKFIGKVYWDVNNFVGYYNTWLISSRSYEGNRITQYYYTYREDIGYEIWVYNDHENKYIYRFDRNYAAGQDPEGTKDMGTYFIAGATSNKPSLDPNNVLIFPRDRDFQIGDILLKNDGNILDLALEWTHIGLYVGSNEVIETNSEGVVYNDLSEWDDDKNVALLRVISAREDQKQSAAKWAESQVGKINSYLWSEKRTDPDSLSWYGSELIWAAYKNQGIDIDFDQSKKFVSPDDIYKDNDIMEISGSQEDLPLLEDYLCIKSKDSVDFNIIDPIGLKINKEICQITGAYYLEGDIDENNDMEAIVLIPKRKIGDYVISIVPKSNALPTDTYSLEVSTEDETIVLVQDELIENIPYDSFIIRSDSSGVFYKNSQENLSIFQMFMLIITLVSILGVVSLIIIFREKKIKNR